MASSQSLFDAVLEQVRSVHANEIAHLNSRISHLERSCVGSNEENALSGIVLNWKPEHVIETRDSPGGAQKLDEGGLDGPPDADEVPGEREECVSTQAFFTDALLGNGASCKVSERHDVAKTVARAEALINSRDFEAVVEKEVPIKAERKFQWKNQEARSSRKANASYSSHFRGSNRRSHHLAKFLGLSEHKQSKDLSDLGKLEKLRWNIGTLLLNPWLEMSLGWIILLNAIVMAFEAQYEGIQVGHELGYPGYSEAANKSWPYAKVIFNVFEIAFGSIYTVEVVLKIFALTNVFFCDIWNLLDLIIVLCFLAEQVMALVFSIGSEFIRCIRLARVARLVKFVRIIEGFDALFLMITAIKGSIVVLLWALVLLFVIQLAIAILFGQILQAVFFDKDNPVGVKQDIYEYFGTFTKSILSIFELTFANWPVICRLLSENVSEWFALAVLIHKLTIGFAVIGVINGVFMQETFKVASSDNTIMVRQKQKASKAHLAKMREFFKSLDHSQDGYVSVDEFKVISEVPEVKLWLASMDLDSDDLNHLFILIDSDHDGYITLEELTKGVSKLRGTARSIDATSLLHLHRESLLIQKEIHEMQTQFHELQHDTRKIMETIRDRDQS